jgi:hypothetical protein
MLRKHKLILAIFCLAAGFFFVTPTWAQTLGEGIIVSPVRIDQLVQPGETINKIIQVTNDSPTPKKLYAYLRDFTAEGEEGRARLIIPGTETGSFLSSWIKITNEGIDFGANEQKDFNFTIAVPKEAGPGGYYGAIIFGTKAPDVKGDGSAIAISQQTGSLVLLQIAGEVDETADVRDFTTDKAVYNNPFSVNFTTRIENRGNVHIKPHGTIEISNTLGRKVGEVRFNDKGSNILPKSIRKFSDAWQGDFGLGRYKASLALSYGTAASAGGQGKQTLYYVVYFWILPWKILLLFGLGLVSLLAAIYAFLKVYKNRAIRQTLTEMGVGKEVYVKKYQGPSPGLHLGLMLLIIVLTVLLIAGAAYFLFFS